MTMPKRKRLNLDCHRKQEIVKFSQCYHKTNQQEIANRFTALKKDVQCVISWQNLTLFSMTKMLERHVREIKACHETNK
jgi:hypothetical protein